MPSIINALTSPDTEGIGWLIRNKECKENMFFQSNRLHLAQKLGLKAVQGHAIFDHPEHGSIIVSCRYYENGGADKKTKKKVKEQIKKIYEEKIADHVYADCVWTEY